ncbi:formylglycine-generating enzyme required for sulfatase activity [Glaciihabitans tibetensis]|uniref:Formylglycine-generating enzyme required for sulfatase activity n=1 Tax=Glaciihabitans tibetensis TaxID=1266600 RepID=A0A2T0VG20_9MICO|nr:formylglycine-generating enzyme family protein [Glaciihabitans tibetensis]PRY69145.1 formylglycine-generating enzyme required for sulfatase activity [Glaciihabitans tibetensis]
MTSVSTFINHTAERSVPMVHLAGGRFLMGSEAFYADEGPVHEVEVHAFDIDLRPVTNRDFARFVDDSGYVTTAERPLPADEYPELSENERAPGALVFRETAGPVPLTNWRRWWDWAPGASWRQPHGVPPTTIDWLDHPVVQVSFDDASAYAAWAGRRLPTEAEWEFAARGGLAAADFAWGSEVRPGGRLMANTWQGAFPYRNEGARGWRGTSPVGLFPANGFGLFDMIGNVWEWTTTAYGPRHVAAEAAAPAVAPSFAPTGAEAVVDGSCCSMSEGEVAGEGAAASVSVDRADRQRVLKGGSHLCAPEYCLRYRPAARSPQTDDTSATHIGFRCVRDA